MLRKPIGINGVPDGVVVVLPPTSLRWNRQLLSSKIRAREEAVKLTRVLVAIALAGWPDRGRC